MTADTHYTVNVTQGERALIDAAAMAEDGERYPSRWVRKVALREAKRIVEGAARPERKAR